MTKIKIITISGKARHGKDSLANMLKEELESKGKRVCIISLADYLKCLATRVYGWNGEKNRNGRILLQTVGTDIVREKDYTFWASIVWQTIDVLRDEFDIFIIPDARFYDEISYFFSFYGADVHSVYIERIGYNSTLTDESKAHISENSLDYYSFPFQKFRHNGLDDLKEKGIQLINSWGLV